MQGSTLRMASYILRPGTSSELQPSAKINKSYYEEKTVGSTSVYKCEACPYMALSEDDIKFHIFTVHLELARSNGLADNISIPCPGCTEVFDAENTLRMHLREHHKMGIRDIRKMVKSLIQIALKNNKNNGLKEKLAEPKPPPHIPEVIEIVPDIVQSNNALSSSVTVISVDELQQMSTPNFDQIDPKEIIKEASINIVYSDEIPKNYISKDTSPAVQNVTPDLICSVQCPKAIHKINDINSVPSTCKESTSIVLTAKQLNRKPKKYEQKEGIKCSVENCCVRLVSKEKLSYHKSCHQNGKLQCPECKRKYVYIKELHTHLWKLHDIDMELHTCNICGYKSHSLSRLNNVHRKIHKKERDEACPICGKTFKSLQQMFVHKVTHKEGARRKCSICLKDFVSEKQLQKHILAVHENRKPFQCGECDFATSRKCSLKTHIRSHTAEDIYKCKQCKFSSTDHNSMRRHKLQHTNEKKYNCKHCSYSCIQSQSYLNHMRNQHPDIQSDDIFTCPYCKFQSVNRDKLMNHLLVHNRDIEKGQQYALDLNNTQQKSNWNTPTEDQPKSWNMPTQSDPIHWNTPETQPKTHWNTPAGNGSKKTWTTPEDNQPCEQSLKTDTVSCHQPTVNDGDNDTPTNLSVPIEVDDCDSEHDPTNYPVNYSYINNGVMPQDKAYHIQDILTDLTKDDNNSDCIISESSNDTVNERHHFSQHPMDGIENMHNNNLREYLGTTVTMGNNVILQNNNNVNVITSNSYENNNMSTSIMNNFPIYLPPRITIRRNLTLTPADKIPLPVPKVTGPIINQNQVLPIQSSSNSPVSLITTRNHNQPLENEAVPKKKAKISVKSNLILKGPDQINMFNPEENLVFGRLQDGERMNLSSPVTFNNLITTCMQMPPEPINSDDGLSVIPPYTHEPVLGDPSITHVKDNRMFTFNRQIDLNPINMMPQQEMQQNKMSIICGNPNFIKLESKQNIQSPSLEKMCNSEMIKTPEISDIYCKSSPRLEDLQKNVNEIKNEIKSDTYFNTVSSQNSPNVMDRHLMEAIIDANELYAAHLDLSGVVLQEMHDEDQQPEIIEIDDNSEDNKLLPPRYNMNYPMDYGHDYYFLDSEINQTCSGTIATEINELGKMSEPPESQAKDGGAYSENQNSNYENFIHSRTDPMMNTSVRPLTNKINVKNIELMKN